MELTRSVGFHSEFKLSVYCSDVSGAFDRVNAERLLAKLRSKWLRPEIVEVLASWLRQRTAQVVVGGKQSADFSLADMVFQGTVLGPVLWNVFFEDARKVTGERLFREIVYADDLNAYRDFLGSTPNEHILGTIDQCQSDLHAWGRANQVAFDPCRESKHALSATDPEGPKHQLRLHAGYE